MKKYESDFGKGLVICLVKFAEHFQDEQYKRLGIYSIYLKMSKEKQDLVMSQNPPDNLNYGKIKEFRWWMTCIVPIYKTPERAMSSDISTFMSCCSDHLYEIEAPKGERWNKISQMVKQLKNKGLFMRGLAHDKDLTIEDAEKLKILSHKIAIDIDKIIGLKPNEGKW